MLQNYLKIAFRSLWKNKSIAVINIGGLTVGTACCLYILLYVLNQYSFDKHHVDGERLFRVVTDISGNESTWQTARLSPPIAPAMAQDFPEVETWTRVVDPPETSHHVLSRENTSFYETKGYYVDSTFFEVFTYKWLSGDPATALDEPYSVVLTKPVAERIFGNDEAVGQSIRINNRFGDDPFKVTGVVDPAAHNSHIRANFYMAMNSGGMGEYVRTSNHWAGNNFISGYVKLGPNIDAPALAAKFPAFLDRHGADQLRESGFSKELTLEPVRDIHLFSTRANQLDTTVSARFLYVLLTIAAFIQLIACINFMNLATARSAQRAKEVGIRKTLGANKGALVYQFMGEAFLLAVVAIGLAVPLVQFALPYLNQLVGSSAPVDFAHHPGVWPAIGGLALATGFLAGVYPAFYLSAFEAVKVLKGHVSRFGSAKGLRKGLVVFQFAVSIALIIGAIVITRQLSYMLNKDLGFDKAQKIVVPFRTEESRRQIPNFKSEILKNSDVKAACGVRVTPGEFVAQDFLFFTEGKDMTGAQLVKILQCDEDYLPVMDIPLLAGRNFRNSDTSRQLIVNEQTLKQLEIALGEAPGMKIFSDWEGTRNSFEIIGVMQNFHFRPLSEELSPLALEYRPAERNFNVILSAKTNSYAGLMASLEQTWNELNPGIPFESRFLDDDLQRQYESETSLSRIINAFTLIAIIISCLGLFGLATFTAEQRTKEIGIRKVLGASVAGITGLLTKDFLKLVGAAIVIAVPAAHWAMNKWLTDFAYRIELQWWMFALAGMAAVAAAILTVGFQSVRAATANPVKALRSE
jgi:putative ABC transport system permease protein